jgi:hypothetical protein
MGKFRIEVTAEAKAEISRHLKSGNQASINKKRAKFQHVFLLISIYKFSI